MWVKKTAPKKLGFHPVKILEEGAINWEFHCGCCQGTAEHSLLTSTENEELFQISDSVGSEPSTIENLLESEEPSKKRTFRKTKPRKK